MSDFFKSLSFGLILCLIFVLTACQKSEPVQQAVPPQQQQTVQQQTQTQNISAICCDDFFKKFTDLKIVSTTQEGIQISTDSNRVVDETTFSKWLGDFAGQIFSSTCTHKKVNISVTLADGYYLEAVLLFSDHELFKQGKISEAEWYRRFDVKRVETVAYLLQSLKKAREAEDHTKALALIDRLLEKEPQNLNVLLIKANVLLDRKLSADALLLYQSVLATQPDNRIALFNLGVAQKELGSFSEAITIFEKLLNLPPVNANTAQPFLQDQIVLQLIDTSLKNNDLERTGRYFGQLKDTASFEAATLKAQYLRMQGKYAEAKDVLQELVNRSGAPAYVLFDLALACLDLKDAPNAKVAFEKLKSADEALARELEFLQPFRSADTLVIPDPAPTQPVSQSASDVIDEDAGYAEQPVETEEEEEKKEKKF